MDLDVNLVEKESSERCFRFVFVRGDQYSILMLQNVYCTVPVICRSKSHMEVVCNVSLLASFRLS